jgi:DNA-binding response OmpR family regulator
MSKTNPVIMIIEDEPLLLEAVVKKLKVHNITTLPFTNGRAAMAYLQKQTELPDAIWLDYYLKDMNGLDFMHELKNNPAWQNPGSCHIKFRKSR